MDEAVLESNHTFVSIKKTSCSTYIYAVREYVRSAKVVLWLGMTGVVGVEVGVGGADGRSITAARPCAPPGGNSNRVEFPSEDINYSFTSETRWRKQKWPITTTVECNEEKFSAFFNTCNGCNFQDVTALNSEEGRQRTCLPRNCGKG